MAWQQLNTFGKSVEFRFKGTPSNRMWRRIKDGETPDGTAIYKYQQYGVAISGVARNVITTLLNDEHYNWSLLLKLPPEVLEELGAVSGMAYRSVMAPGCQLVILNNSEIIVTGDCLSPAGRAVWACTGFIPDVINDETGELRFRAINRTAVQRARDSALRRMQ